MANPGELVPVGQVFQVFDGKNDTKYIGIRATASFARRHRLVCCPPDSSHESGIPLLVSTIEINRQRANVVHSGSSCGVRPSQKLTEVPEPGWKVFASSKAVTRASALQQVLSDRPIPPPELRRRMHSL